jgi:lipoyl-dependent peroxiredoxin
MIQRKASAVWEKGLKNGNGTLETGSGVLKENYNFSKRFENEPGTNPDELLAAAHASCFAMALSAGLEKAGYSPEKVSTREAVNLVNKDGGFVIESIDLEAEAVVKNIDEEQFRRVAHDTKENCPISKALSPNIKVNLKAVLKSS